MRPLCPHILETADCATPTLAQPGRTWPQAQILCCSRPWPHITTLTHCHCREGTERSEQSPEPSPGSPREPTTLGATVMGWGHVTHQLGSSIVRHRVVGREGPQGRAGPRAVLHLHRNMGAGPGHTAGAMLQGPRPGSGSCTCFKDLASRPATMPTPTTVPGSCTYGGGPVWG